MCWGQGACVKRNRWVQHSAGRVDKKKSLVFESGEQEKTGALIGGCQGDGPWGLLNFFSVLPPEQRAAIECSPGLKAEGSGVDPEPGETLGQGDRDARDTRLPPPPHRPCSPQGLSPENLGLAEQQASRDREAAQPSRIARPLDGNTVPGAMPGCPRQALL